MLKRDFHYHLPPELIAQRPAAHRGESRLLVLRSGDEVPVDRMFSDLPQFLEAGDLLVFNDTRVIPARVFATKATGGRVEVLVERLTGPHEVLAHARSSKPLRAGARLEVEGGPGIEVLGREGDLFRMRFESPLPVLELLHRHGHVPLPPYIGRADDQSDLERYQTVYARSPGAVAAPTAGLHFDREMLDRLEAMQVERCFLTLHVGAGTFQPVRADRIEDHQMHREWLQVGMDVCRAVARARARGGRVVAVGTTAVRALEAAAAGGSLCPFTGETEIFIYPGYRFRVVDALITNFHLPESTLLMLVSAFAGRERVLAAYRHAVAARYRFFSYGDAMLLTRLAGA